MVKITGGETAEGRMPTDAELVQAFREGREEAFNELVRRHMEKAVQRASFALGNDEDAKDVSQEAFVKAYRSLKSFEMKSKFSTWFYPILMNSVRDFLRKRNWRRFLRWETNESMENFFERLPHPGPSPSQRLTDRELAEKISQATRTLPFRQQWVFNLRFVEGLSIREISEASGMAEGTVKATLHFAVRKFRRAISPDVAEGRR